VSFRHGLLRDTAYEALPFRIRRDLHAAVGDRIARAAGDDLASVAELLSFHFHHAQRHADAWQHALVAGDAARTVFANVEAARFYERALLAARHLSLIGSDVAPVHEALALVQTRLGAYVRADRSYRAARRLRRDDPIADAGLALRIAWLQGYLERYVNARRWVSRALRRLDGVAGVDADIQRAELLACQARFAQEAGSLRSAVRWCRRAIDAGDAAGADVAVAEAEKILGWANLYNGRNVEATPHLERALARFELLGDLSGQASVLNMMGASAYWLGDWSRALDLYSKARDLVGRTGNAVMQAFCTNNIGEILCDQGRLEEAERLFRQALRVWQAAGHRSRVAYAKTNLARVALRAERHSDALRLYEEALAESSDIGAHADVLESDARIAECLLGQGRWAQALALAESGLDDAQTLGGSPPQTVLLERVRGAALLQLGDVARARASLEASLAEGRVRHADYEIALTLQVMADLSEHEDGDRDIDLDAESRAIFARLGVVSS
jgi:tetratricopeptide (TPR) repeat protein